MLLPKPVAHPILEGRVTRARLPRTRWTPKRTDTLRIARYHRDDEGRVVKVTAGRVLMPLLVDAYRLVPELDDLTDADARDEGYDDAIHLRDVFLETYKAPFTGSPGYVVDFHLDRSDTVRLLPRQNGARVDFAPGDLADAGQYTSAAARALRDEPEAVDPAEVDRGRTALELRQRYVKAKLQEEQQLARMTLGERLDRELAAAEAAGRNVERYRRSIEARLRALERRSRTDG
jgi:hypothetical protein